MMVVVFWPTNSELSPFAYELDVVPRRNERLVFYRGEAHYPETEVVDEQPERRVRTVWWVTSDAYYMPDAKMAVVQVDRATPDVLALGALEAAAQALDLGRVSNLETDRERSGEEQVPIFEWNGGARGTGLALDRNGWSMDSDYLTELERDLQRAAEELDHQNAPLNVIRESVTFLLRQHLREAVRSGRVKRLEGDER